MSGACDCDSEAALGFVLGALFVGAALPFAAVMAVRHVESVRLALRRKITWEVDVAVARQRSRLPPVARGIVEGSAATVALTMGYADANALVRGEVSERAADAVLVELGARPGP